MKCQFNKNSSLRFDLIHGLHSQPTFDCSNMKYLFLTAYHIFKPYSIGRYVTRYKINIICIVSIFPPQKKTEKMKLNIINKRNRKIMLSAPGGDIYKLCGQCRFVRVRSNVAGQGCLRAAVNVGCNPVAVCQHCQ